MRKTNRQKNKKRGGGEKEKEKEREKALFTTPKASAARNIVMIINKKEMYPFPNSKRWQS